MNLVVLTAVLSCLNSGLYTASRMLFALANQGHAPKGLVDTNDRGVPVKAILFCMLIGYLSVAMDYLSPNTVFLFLLNSSGAVGLFIYLLIAVSELRIRRKLEQESPESLRVRMWAYPYLTYLTIIAIVVVIASMAFTADNRSQLILSLVSVVILMIIFAVKQTMSRNSKLPGNM
jgi:GABA permease